MNIKTTIHIAVTILIGCVFLAVGIYYWYDLHQVEQGLKQGQLPFILLKIYETAGKWGVAGFYSLFSVFCFWRAYSIKRRDNDNSYGYYSDNEDEDK